ncbi:hypothetical protein [Enterococcus phage vB_Efm_LG62]|uniref:Uncharacterized protein n=1 Tax=Enterococcus phage vB_Efm_LG62 TaxID=2970334 RepID=A0A976SGA7_9CAUD|nr:hypothetical protein [Enterococcus phage vB_Efm_LG62]
MYIVEIINPETAELYYSPEVFSTLKEAEDYLQEACEDTLGLEGVIVSVLLEKSAIDERMILVSADVVYNT